PTSDLASPHAARQTMGEATRARGAGRTAMGGDVGVVDVARTVAVDSIAQSVFRAMQAMGVERVHDPERVALFVDHVAPASTVQVAEVQAALRRFARDQEITRFYDAGSGICHQLMIEEHLVTPGTVVVGSDSHSTIYGCV